MSSEKRANRLISESSPYLRQHAHNPVDWHPWGEEAWARARREDLPILLSVGYSACHWCHVMERESFENPQIAALMNARFVCIKVDREERPDLDDLYMTAVQAMTGSGGWPMTVFLTPQLRPFYGGTYFPPDDRYGRPGFGRILVAVSDHFRAQRDKVEDQAGRLVDALRQNTDFLQPSERRSEEILGGTFRAYRDSFDVQSGGFGGAPKFPAAPALLYLLRHHRRTGEAHALHMVLHTLDRMRRGGVYDQLGGGFHRYSVDERWLVPHFEKMLYDNALLTWVCVEAYQATGRSDLRRLVSESLDYVRREMELPAGGYRATQDADSEGEEGRFFVWRPEELEAALGAEGAALLGAHFGVTAGGNFDGGSSVLHVAEDAVALAARLGRSADEVAAAIQSGAQQLLEVRRGRVPPARDDKLITSWNGLMISAMARAGAALGAPLYLDSAGTAARFILEEMVTQGRLHHSCMGDRLGGPGFCDDYAGVIGGLIDLYEAGLDPRWLAAAVELADQMIDRFWDDERGGFYYTEAGAADLIVRSRSPFDGATPSGNSMAALSLLRLAAMTGRQDLRRRAEDTLELFADLMSRSPTSCSLMVCALDFAAEPPSEIAVVGTPQARGSLLLAAHSRYLPTKVVVGGDPGEAAALALVPLLEGKGAADGGAAAYLCRAGTCWPPVRTAAELLQLLDAPAPR
ncbi:MAG: thioredoxin domain-containing protein [Gemmatimonadota bacterium]